MTSVEPTNLADAETPTAQNVRKPYHSPEFQEYGTVADLTRQSPTFSVIQDGPTFGYISQTT